jgi:hypothetical protein
MLAYRRSGAWGCVSYLAILKGSDSYCRSSVISTIFSSLPVPSGSEYESPFFVPCNIFRGAIFAGKDPNGGKWSRINPYI